MKNELTVVFRSASDIEARVVRGLLESHGISSLLSAGLSRSIFPVAVDGNADVRISVRPEDAEEARRLKEERGSKTKACSMCGPFCPMNLVEAVLKGKGRMELPVA